MIKVGGVFAINVAPTGYGFGMLNPDKPCVPVTVQPTLFDDADAMPVLPSMLGIAVTGNALSVTPVLQFIANQYKVLSASVTLIASVLTPTLLVL